MKKQELIQDVDQINNLIEDGQLMIVHYMNGDIVVLIEEIEIGYKLQTEDDTYIADAAELARCSFYIQID